MRCKVRPNLPVLSESGQRGSRTHEELIMYFYTEGVLLTAGVT